MNVSTLVHKLKQMDQDTPVTFFFEGDPITLEGLYLNMDINEVQFIFAVPRPVVEGA